MRKPGRLERMQRKAMMQKKVKEAWVATEEKWMRREELDRIREEEKATFDDSKAALDKGLAGVKAALKILTEYYAKDDKAHEAADGAGGGIISLLEVVEADFSKNL